MYGYWLISHEACYLGKFGWVGASDLIPRKTLLKISVNPHLPSPWMLPVRFNKGRARPCAVRDRHSDTTGRHKYRGRHRFRLTDCRQRGDPRHREHKVKDVNLNLLLFKWLTPRGSAFHSFVQHQCLVGTQNSSWMRLVRAEECYLLLSPHGLLSVPFSTSLRYLHKDSTIHSGLDPLTSIS